MWKKIFLLLIAAFIALQFVQPSRPAAPADPAADLLAHTSPPAPVRVILTEACYDCHSEKTKYPWYAQIQPAAWFLNEHVKEGKKALNFSRFGRLSAKAARKQLENCIDQVSDKQMPLKSYTLIHGDARLTDEQRKIFVDWAEGEIRRRELSLANSQ